MNDSVNVKKKLFAPNLVVVGVDSTRDGDFQGRVWDQYHTAARPFRSSMELLREVDALFDDIDFPQRSTIPRSFQPVKFSDEKFPEHKERQVIMKDMDDKNGEKGTFIVQVKYRQNSTWQGQVVWAEQNKKVYFRSALELLKLIDSAIQQGNVEGDVTEQQAEE